MKPGGCSKLETSFELKGERYGHRRFDRGHDPRRPADRRIAGFIWKDNRPYGAGGDYIGAVAAAW